MSNETQNEKVFLDNLTVQHYTGPLTEETQYYPFGLVMKGISSKAATVLENRYKYNGKEAQSKGFSDGSGLEWLDYGARMYDGQVGRFFTQDRFAEKFNTMSVYGYAAENPTLLVDENGDYMSFYSDDRKYVIKNDSKDGWGFYDEQGKRYEGTNRYMESVVKAISMISGVTDNDVQGRLNFLVTDNFEIEMRDPSASGGFDGLTDYKKADGTIEAVGDPKNGYARLQDKNIVGVRINWDADTWQPVNLWVSMSSTARTNLLRDPSLNFVHEVLGHGYQASKRILKYDRLPITFGVLPNGEYGPVSAMPMAEADAITISNIVARGVPSLKNQIDTYYPERGPNGRMTFHKALDRWLFGTR